ncbi:MAG TPA: hypothetical protein VFI46_05875, partial [Jiangellaceae bacterium]|nr:hypothetical protein [Jiangellaceae bacterium]
MFPGTGAVVVECAGHLVGVSRSGESRSDDLPAPSAIYPLHHGLGTLNRDLLAPIVRPGLPLPYHVPWRRRRRNDTPD